MMRRHALYVAGALLASALACGPARAAGSGSGSSSSSAGEDPPNFFEVQQYDQPFAGWVEPTIWTTGVLSSTQRYQHFGQDLPRKDLTAHSGELEYGLTDRITVGSYFDFVAPADGPGEFAQARLVARYRFSNRQELFFNPAVYVEYYIPRAGYGDQQVEFRGILDKDLGDFRVVLNPTVSVMTTGSEAGHTPSIGLSAGVYWRRHYRVQPGLEYYAEYGPINNAVDTKQYLLPTADIAITPEITWHLGAGFGLTRGSDRFVLESQLRFEFAAFRPSHLFGRRAGQ